MNTAPPGIRRVSLRAALGLGAAFTAAAFGAGLALAADECQFIRDGRSKDAEAAARALRDAARDLERVHR